MEKCENLCKYLPIEQINNDFGNPRTVDTTSDDFIELVKSVKASGVVIPLHVRNHPGEQGQFQLLAGERRLRAAEAALVKTVPVVNYGELGDEAAMEITFIENFARKDLTAIEAGKAVSMMMESCSGDAEIVAAKLGKSRRWVLQRQKMFDNLCDEIKEGIENNATIRAWPLSHIQLIAALPKKVQQEVFNDLEMEEYLPEMTADELSEKLAKNMNLLFDAGWDKDDATLIKGAPACSECPRRSSFQPGLFDDDDDIEKTRKNDRCLDDDCFRQKKAAALKNTVAALRTKHPNLTIIATDNPNYYEKENLRKDFGVVIEKGQYTPAKENGKDALPAVIVHGPQSGQLKWVRFKSSTSGKKSTPVGKPSTLKERRQRLDSKRWFEVLRKMAGLTKKSTVEDITATKEPPFKTIRELFICTLIHTFGVGSVHQHRVGFDDFKKLFDGLVVGLEKPEETADIYDLLWTKVARVLSERMTYNGNVTEIPQDFIDEARTLAGYLGIDIEAMFKKQVKAIPEPKAWAGLKADGTPKTVKKVKTKKAG